MPGNKIPPQRKSAAEHYLSAEKLEKLEGILAGKAPDASALLEPLKKGIKWEVFADENKLQKLSQLHELQEMQKRLQVLSGKKSDKLTKKESSELGRLPTAIQNKLTALKFPETQKELSPEQKEELKELAALRGKKKEHDVSQFKKLQEWKLQQVHLSEELDKSKDADIVNFQKEQAQQKKLLKEEDKQAENALQQFVNKIFPPGSKAHALLYEGEEKYKNSKEAKIKEYYSAAGITDPLLIKEALENPNFFRNELNLVLNGKLNQLLASGKPIENTGNIAKLEQLLGDSIFKLYKEALREERFDRVYINECIKEATIELKSGKRPIIPFLGPSGGGKSTARKHQALQDALKALLPPQTGEGQSEYSMVIDGGIERDKSRPRKDMIAFTAMHGFKDAVDIDPLDGKLKKQLLAATEKTENVGMVLVTTASKYVKGTTIGKLAETYVGSAHEFDTVKHLAQDPNNIVIPVNIIAKAEDKQDFIDSVQTGADLRSQAIKMHFDQINKYVNDKKGEIPYEALIEKLPEFKEYKGKNFKAGYNGSAKFAEAVRSFTPDNSVLHVYRDLVYMQLDTTSGKLVKGDALDANGEVVGKLTSKRVVASWNAAVDAGIGTVLKACSEKTKPEGKNDYVQITTDENGNWIAGPNTTDPHWVKQELFDAYSKKDWTPLREAYVGKYTIPLIHTSGEFKLYELQQKFEKAPSSKAIGAILKAIQAFNLAREPVEARIQVNIAKDYPSCIDRLEKVVEQNNTEINRADYKTFTDCIKQLKGETDYRIKVALSPTEQQTERMYYNANVGFSAIKTSIKTKEESQKAIEVLGKSSTGTNKTIPTKGPDVMNQTGQHEVIFKGDVVTKDQVIVAEGKLGNGTVYLEQDHQGKVTNKSHGFKQTNPQDSRELQKIALVQAQMLLNNYTPPNKIAIESGDAQQGARMYAAVLYFVQHDPEIKKRMRSSRWVPSYSPEQLINSRGIPHFIAPKTLSSDFIKLHLPITKEKEIREEIQKSLPVLSNQKRETIQSDIKKMDKSLDVVQTDTLKKQKDYKVWIRQNTEETKDNTPESPHP